MKGREDDNNIQTILERFKVFKECTLPVIEYYSTIGKVHKVIYCFSKLWMYIIINLLYFSENASMFYTGSDKKPAELRMT